MSISQNQTNSNGERGRRKVSIIVPCYNEASNIKRFYDCALEQLHFAQKQIPNLDYEFVFINDGSTDNTLEILENLASCDNRIRFIDFSRNFGKESAILAGLRHSHGDAIILIDADLQDPAELISQMLYHHFIEGKDIICVKRNDRSGDGIARRIFTHIFYKFHNLINTIKLDNGVRDFRLMSREVVDCILEMGEYHRFSKAIFEWVGFEKIYLEYSYIPREAGVSGWSFWKLFKYAIEGIVSFSTAPLRIAFIAGFFASLIALIYTIYILIDTLIFGNPVKGYPSLVCIILFLGGLQLIVLGIIGEYIARIYEQVKHRPHYFIKKKKQ